MANTIETVQAWTRVIKRQASHDELLAEIGALETTYPGLNADNAETFFNGPDGIIPDDQLVDAMRAWQIYYVASLGPADNSR
ncbi:MAG: hypothetical protein WCI74_07800 [Actinomycetes bacterium]